MEKAMRGLAAMSLSLLICAQTDPHGALLINGYHGLAFVAIMLGLVAVVEFTLALANA